MINRNQKYTNQQ